MPRSRVSHALDWLALLLAIALRRDRADRRRRVSRRRRAHDRPQPRACRARAPRRRRAACRARSADAAVRGPARRRGRIREVVYDRGLDEHAAAGGRWPMAALWPRAGGSEWLRWSCSCTRSSRAWTRFPISVIRCFRSGDRAGCSTSCPAIRVRSSARTSIYPYPLTFTYSDSMLLPALTTAPFLMAGVHPVHAYNVVVLLSFIASGLAMYVLVEKLTASPAAAFVAALLFGFYPYRFEHYRSLRAADDVLHAARAPRAASAGGDGAAARRARGRPACRRSAVLLDVLRRLLRALLDRRLRERMRAAARTRSAGWPCRR